LGKNKYMKDKKLKICLVYPNQTELPSFFDKVTNIPKNPVLLPPLGLLYIASNSKYKIDVLDNRVEELGNNELFKKLKEYDVVGFGGTIFENKQAVDISCRLNKLGITTIYGGPNATVNWELYLGKFSYIIRGEAEKLIDKLLNRLKSKNKEFIYKNGTYVSRNINRIENLDELKFPNRDLINLSKYKRFENSYLPNIFPVDTVASSRGCPFDCTFCSSSYIWQRRYTLRSVDNVIDEIKMMIKKYGTRAIYFREDNFTISKKRILEFCEKIKDLKIRWMCESRVDTLDEEMIKKMKKSGCDAIWFGIESTNNKTLQLINKGFKIETAIKTINLCRSYKIKTGGGFMLGFPHEKKEDILKTIKESKKLDLDITFYNRVWAVPKSQMYNFIIKNKLDTYRFENIIIPATKYLSADEVTNLYYNNVGKDKWEIMVLKKIIGEKKLLEFKNRHPLVVNFLKKFF
jgi:anaerobic magnesium-protoporphyrin IX monomethyl ester cyclase